MMASRALALSCLFIASVAAAGEQPRPDARGCQDSPLLTRMPGCRIASCRRAEYDGVRVRATTKKETMLEGGLEVIRYSCPKESSALQLAANAKGALRAAGYEITYEDAYATTRRWVTGKKGPQWIAVYAGNDGYEVTTVLTKEMEQVMEATAKGWADQINRTGRASVYGINFDTGKATIRPDSEKVLEEMATLLRDNAGWDLVVAGHTDNVGADTVNVPLSRERAQAVVAWLARKGIDRQRLVPLGFGARKPLADNATDDGRARNRRVDLVKLY